MARVWIDRPNRNSEDRQLLLELEAKGGRPTQAPQVLRIEDIGVLPGLFQPRDWSLGIAPHNSVKHITVLKKVLENGSTLDPVAVMAFGSRWFLIDGHHRLEAYKQVDAYKEIPVDVIEYDGEHEKRIDFAILKSIEVNSKNKLPMSDIDKMNAAWRLLANVGWSITKEKHAGVCGVSTTTISNMRATLHDLVESGRFEDSEYEFLSWSEARRYREELLTGKREHPNRSDYKELREFIQKLSEVVHVNTPASLVLDALENIAPGITDELEEIIRLRREYPGPDI